MKKKYLFIAIPLLLSMVACNNNAQDSTTTNPSINDNTSNVETNTSEPTLTPSTNEPITSEPTSTPSTSEPTTTPVTSEPTTTPSTSEETTTPPTSEPTLTPNTSVDSSSPTEIVALNYDITFDKTNESEINSSVFKLPSSIKATTTKCYGTNEKSIRLGTSKADGSINLKLSNDIKINKIIITGQAFSNDSSSGLKISLSTGEELKQNISSNKDYIFSFDSNYGSNEINIATYQKKKRVVISKIRIEGVSSNTSENLPSGGDKKSLVYNSSFVTTKGNVVDQKEVHEGYYRPTINSNLNIDNVASYVGDCYLPSRGTSKMLVVPVDFKDYRAEKKLGGETKSQKNIFDTFFGEEKDTGWESLRTFYEKSSYGALSLEGEVTPWYNSSYTVSQFATLTDRNSTNPDNYDPTWTLLNEVTEWAETSLNIDISEYDTNNDGLVDGVWMVYACPTNDNYDTYWAYTYSNYDNLDKYLDSNDSNLILPFKYCWASYHFMNEGYGDKLDAHTFIHETGHMMGLDDYYSYDTNVIEGVSGGVDMMDLNIGDHDSYSKYLLNWTSPYVVDNTLNEVNISLRPFESSGDCILLKTDFNDSPYDEYLMIEYYTPTGLNEKDSLGYASGFNTYTQPGVKIYHVDSRLALVNGYNEKGNYVDEVREDTLDYEYYMIAANNTPAYSVAYDELSKTNPYRLLHLIEADNNYTFNKFGYEDRYGSNKVLFHEGDTFSMAKYNKFFTRGNALNDKTNMPYTITIGSTNSDGSISINLKK